LRVPLILLPKGIRAAVEADSSAERLCAFLLAPERDNQQISAEGGAVDACDGEKELRHVTVLIQDSAGGTCTQDSGGWGRTPSLEGRRMPSLAPPPSGVFDDSAQPAAAVMPRGRIEMVRASFAYGKGSALLRDISLQCAPGSLTIITGTVGAGKSNLLAAILRQMSCVTGQSSSVGSFAYVPQTSWCAHGTVRDNILFGKTWDERRYRQVLFACALERDMTLLADGDLTEIGERGMNLSGGQRQRIAIARATYASADLVLLDSPLSAVDSYTMQHIFRNAISGLMKEEGATILLVTHHVDLLPEADTLVVMADGTATYVGEPTSAVIQKFFPSHEHEMEDVPDAEFSKETADVPWDEPPDAPASGGSILAGTVNAASSSCAFQPASPSIPSLQRMRGSAALVAHEQTSSVNGAMLSTLGEGDVPPGRQSLDQRGWWEHENALGEGDVPRGRQSLDQRGCDNANAKTELTLLAPGSMEYTAFCARRTAARLLATRSKESSMGGGASGNSDLMGNSYLILLWEIRWYIFVPVLCQFVATQLVRIFSDIWIAAWVRKDYQNRGGKFTEDYWYTSVYAGYVAVFAVMLFIRGYVFYKPFVAAATRLHDKMFAALLRAPMSFFTLTPLGNVLASVSKDMDTITETLLEDMMIAIVYCCILGTTIGVVIKTVNVFAAIAGIEKLLGSIKALLRLC
jgi:ABC-type multidrug transport system fused ATPase/permease subunit